MEEEKKNLAPRKPAGGAAEPGRAGEKLREEEMQRLTGDRHAGRALREYADFLLSLPVSDGRRFNKLARLGIPPEGIDNKMAVVAALIQQAQNGSVPAAKELRSILGEDGAHQEDTEVRIIDDL